MHLTQGLHAIANQRGLFIGKIAGGYIHLLGQRIDHFIGFTLQKQRGLFHVIAVVGIANQAHARCRAALNLMLQTRSTAIAEHAVFTGAQFKDFLQQLYALAHGHRVGERPKILRTLALRAAMKSQTRLRVGT